MKAEYINHMGDDLTVVNAARVSFDAKSLELVDSDRGLIQFLARGCKKQVWDDVVTLLQSGTLSRQEIEAHLKWAKRMPTHWTPFSHPMVSILETVPIFVARQRFKHTVGFTYNEVSRRYVDDTPVFHVPDEWRARPENGIKQGSGGALPAYEQGFWASEHEDHCEESRLLYTQMIDHGVAPEQARMELPQSMLTMYWATGSLYAWANACTQRSDAHAQLEIQHLSKQWDEIIRPLFPESWSALVD